MEETRVFPLLAKLRAERYQAMIHAL
jgi:hypothetical protein